MIKSRDIGGILSVMFLGLLSQYIINLPFLLIGPRFKPTWRIAGKILLFSMASLRWTQPWWRGDISVKMPETSKKGELGCLTVSNHRSHIDAFIILSEVPNVRLLTKHLIFMIPGLGGAAFLLRMILVRRGNEKSFWKAMNKIKEILSDQGNVHVFPEMTRCPAGATELGRFTLAPFQKAMEAKVPVLPIVMWGTDMLWPKGTYKIALKAPLIVKSLEPVNSTQFSTAKELADYVRDQIQNEQIKLSQLYPYGEV